jgi:hypothetical protein
LFGHFRLLEKKLPSRGGHWFANLGGMNKKSKPTPGKCWEFRLIVESDCSGSTL